MCLIKHRIRAEKENVQIFIDNVALYIKYFI